jgi:reductive dehalogenase
MAVTLERPTEPLGDGGAPPVESRTPVPGAPNLGRTVKVVGPVEPVDPNQGPHPKNSRGELGKALFNYYRNNISKDPLGRVGAGTHSADRRNVISEYLNRAPKGDIRADRMPVTDPEAMTRHIKRVGESFGADIVGIARAHPSILYGGSRYSDDGTTIADSGGQETPEELCRKYPYLVFATTAWDYEKVQAHRHHIGDAAYHFSQMKANLVLKSLEGYIKELGYNVLRATANPQATAIAAGVGELGRNGLVITPRFGARVHMPNTIMTDLPLAPGEPIDIGVDDFCKVCRKCAITCPTNSISFGEKVVFNGVEKYKINWLTCYKLRPFVTDYWGSCLTCVAVCPFTKPDTWWHNLAIRSLQTTPLPLREKTVRALKAIDDRFWGVVKQKRVQWMGYDSGIKPGEKACTVAGCTASHDEASHNASAVGDQGYYFPLKENTNRFVRRDVV